MGADRAAAALPIRAVATQLLLLLAALAPAVAAAVDRLQGLLPQAASAVHSTCFLPRLQAARGVLLLALQALLALRLLRA